MNSNFFDQLKAFDPEQYRGINNDYLLSYGLSLLQEQPIPATFENITVIVFKLFPENFSLLGFSEYPDAARINRTLLHCRPNYQNLVDGSVRDGFALTKQGEYVVNQVANNLKSKRKGAQSKIAKKGRDRTYTGAAIVEKIENSSLFKNWQDNKLDDIGPYDIWSFLEAVPYTEKSVLKEIMNGFKQSAQAALREDVSKFLMWVEKKYSYVFK